MSDDIEEAKRTVRSVIDGMLDNASLGELYASYIAVQGTLSRHKSKRGGRKG